MPIATKGVNLFIPDSVINQNMLVCSSLQMRTDQYCLHFFGGASSVACQDFSGCSVFKAFTMCTKRENTFFYKQRENTFQYFELEDLISKHSCLICCHFAQVFCGDVKIFYWFLSTGFITLYCSFSRHSCMALPWLQSCEDFGSFYPYPKDKCTGNEVDHHDNPQRCFLFECVSWCNTLYEL